MLGNEIETAFIQAEYYYLAANTQLAIDKLKFIKQRYKLDYYQEQRATARMTEYEYELALGKKTRTISMLRRDSLKFISSATLLLFPGYLNLSLL